MIERGFNTKKIFLIQKLRPIFKSGPYSRASIIGASTVDKALFWNNSLKSLWKICIFLTKRAILVTPLLCLHYIHWWLLPEMALLKAPNFVGLFLINATLYHNFDCTRSFRIVLCISHLMCSILKQSYTDSKVQGHTAVNCPSKTLFQYIKHGLLDLFLAALYLTVFHLTTNNIH